MKTIILSLLLAVCIPAASFSQIGIPSDGREFFLGLLSPSINSQSISIDIKSFYAISALVSSPNDDSVSVSYFDTQGNEFHDSTYFIKAGLSVQIFLKQSSMIVSSDSSEIPVFKTCHIVSQKPIAVHFFSYGACAGGSYLALPLQCWGKQYVVESYHDNVGGVGGNLSNEDAAGLFEVIASQDSTVISIVPSSTTSKKHFGVNCGNGATGIPQPFQVTLRRGQCYLVRSEAQDPNCDISGSTVVSNKPVAVICGHENAFTDGSDPAPGGNRPLDARDFMVEEMMPVEIWDTSGFVSIPFYGSQAPVSAGVGDQYSFFCGIIPGVNGTGQKATELVWQDTSGHSVEAAPYTIPAASIIGEIGPLSVYSRNGTPFGVMMYDQREHGGGPPYPAPSMMSIVPMSRWKNDYSWSVPNNAVENMQGYYINLICDRNDFITNHIFVSYNGGKLLPIQASGLGVKRKYTSLPLYGNDDLLGVTLSLVPGSYYVTGDTLSHPFMIYNYGDRAFDVDKNLGDFDGDDFFFSYADPTGLVFKQFGAIRPKITASVTRHCNFWTVCVNDSGDAKTGIRFIELVNYQSTSLGTPAPAVASNVGFAPAVDVLGKGEIVLPGTDKQYCFDVYSKNIQDPSLLSLAIYDNSGERLLVSAPEEPSVAKVSASGNLTMNTSGIFAFTPTPKDTTLCGTIVISRPTSLFGTDLQIDQIFLLRGTTGITISSFPKFPIILHPGDSVSIGVCFTPRGLYLSADSIGILTGGCGSAYYVGLEGQAASGRLVAPDLDLGGLFRGDTLCKTITLTNSGLASFQLKGFTLSDSTEFTASSILFQYLPITLDPGKSLDVTICFFPHADSAYHATIVWQTDIPADFISSSKLTTNITGRGNAFDITWLRKADVILADSTKKPIFVIKRFYLHNRTAQTATVDLVQLLGGDSTEFSISASQKNSTANVAIGASDSIWFDVAFVPDIAKPYPLRYTERTTNLSAIFRPSPKDQSIDTTAIHLTGTFNSHFDAVAREPQDRTLSAFIQGRALIVRIPSSGILNSHVELYDLLGREIAAWDNVAAIDQHFLLPIPNLASGAYVVRIGTNTCTVLKR